MTEKGQRPAVIFGISEFKTLFVWVMILIMLFLAGNELTNKNVYEIIPPDGAWEMRSSDTAEKYIYNTISGEKIYKAYSYDRYGEFSEVPIEEYMKFKNTTPTLTGEYEILDSFTRCSDSPFIEYAEESISSYYGPSELMTSSLAGPGSISFMEMLDDSYTYTDPTHTFFIPQGMTAGINFVAQLTITEGTRNIKPLGITLGHETECVYERHQNGERKGFYEVIIRESVIHEYTKGEEL